MYWQGIGYRVKKKINMLVILVLVLVMLVSSAWVVYGSGFFTKAQVGISDNNLDLNIDKLYDKKVLIISMNIGNLGNVVEAEGYKVKITTLLPETLEKADVTNIVNMIADIDAVVLDEQALRAISRRPKTVDYILRSQIPLVLVARRPLELLLANYSPENAPLAVVPVKLAASRDSDKAAHGYGRALRKPKVQIGLAHDVYALIVVTHQLPRSAKLAATYIAYNYRVSLGKLLGDVFKLTDTIGHSGAAQVFLAAPTIDGMYTWQGLGSYNERIALTSDILGRDVGEASVWLHFSYASDYRHITRPELGLWRVEAIHQVEATENSYALKCYLPGELTSNYWIGEPNKVAVNVELFDDQDIVDMWPYSETTGPTSISVSFIPEKPYLAPTVTLEIGDDIYVAPHRSYSYSSYYGYDRVYEARWNWGEDLPSFFRGGYGRVGVAAYITALKEIPEYGVLGGAYVGMTFTGSLLCEDTLRNLSDNPKASVHYMFYVSPLHVELLDRYTK